MSPSSGHQHVYFFVCSVKFPKSSTSVLVLAETEEAQSPPKEGFVAKLSRSFLDPARQRDSLVSEDISARTRTFKLLTALLSNMSNVFVFRQEKQGQVND
ncbi:hypothetical protein GAYE_SCF61G6552 [Galdieria yellowstonensis]|uniref:Uncharacterized protein n=1 Tax=Galdieria yellowstonensis TaxID=3028027 RepID=A0AAV9IMB9_9RHOD|nr:hypothetical protein GAYE_SCF61G6552 [Galdieria yellowstonensis]